MTPQEKAWHEFIFELKCFVNAGFKNAKERQLDQQALQRIIDANTKKIFPNR